MGGGGGGTQKVKQDPWGRSQGFLSDIMNEGSRIYGEGGYETQPYTGDRVAGMSDLMQQGQDMITARATGPQMTDTAGGTLTAMMNPNYPTQQRYIDDQTTRLNEWSGRQADSLAATKEQALDAAIPAALAPFAGSGMLNSTMAMDTVGQAASDAIAPIEYNAMLQTQGREAQILDNAQSRELAAMDAAQGRALSAAGMAPGLDSASYLPGQMLYGLGTTNRGINQQFLDADMAQFMEGQNIEANALDRYSNLIRPIGHGGGTQTTTTSGGGASMGQKIAGAGLAGLGTYGALAAPAVGLAGPLAIGGGLLAGLSGLL